MPEPQPILFYDLVAQKGLGAPYFSPATIRARLGFALKQVPIETVEVSEPGQPGTARAGSSGS